MAQTLPRTTLGRVDRFTPGRATPEFPPDVLVAVKALACEVPTKAGVPLARWHSPDLARTAIEQGIVASISGTTIWR